MDPRYVQMLLFAVLPWYRWGTIGKQVEHQQLVNTNNARSFRFSKATCCFWDSSPWMLDRSWQKPLQKALFGFCGRYRVGVLAFILPKTKMVFECRKRNNVKTRNPARYPITQPFIKKNHKTIGMKAWHSWNILGPLELLGKNVGWLIYMIWYDMTCLQYIQGILLPANL